MQKDFFFYVAYPFGGLHFQVTIFLLIFLLNYSSIKEQCVVCWNEMFLFCEWFGFLMYLVLAILLAGKESRLNRLYFMWLICFFPYMRCCSISWIWLWLVWDIALWKIIIFSSQFDGVGLLINLCNLSPGKLFRY